MKSRKTLQRVHTFVDALASVGVDSFALCYAIILQALFTVTAADFRVPLFVMIITVLWSHVAFTLASVVIPVLSGRVTLRSIL